MHVDAADLRAQLGRARRSALFATHHAQRGLACVRSEQQPVIGCGLVACAERGLLDIIGSYYPSGRNRPRTQLPLEELLTAD